MPYIPRSKRAKVNILGAETPGELGYALAKVIDKYLTDKSGEIRFKDLAEVLAGLESVKLEFYRRVVAPYEDGKLEANGEVFGVLERL